MQPEAREAGSIFAQCFINGPRRSVEALDTPGPPTRARFLRVVGGDRGAGFFRARDNRGFHCFRALAPGFRTNDSRHLSGIYEQTKNRRRGFPPAISSLLFTNASACVHRFSFLLV